MDGKSNVNFAALRGPIIVNVWGSWCAPCSDEIPILRSFYSQAKAKLQVLGIDVEEGKASDGSNFVVEQAMTWPSLVDPDGRSRSLFGMGVPVTWFIDADGKVAFKKIGVLKSIQELRDLTQKYLHLTVS
jgi:thiol-disulfide isomerase/thioredoxin